jgi:uncharacterized protein (DUF983 family)
MQFMREFPDDAACLEWLWRNRYSEGGEHADCSKCRVERTFKRYATAQQRQSWTCTACGLHIRLFVSDRGGAVGLTSVCNA